jgi:hypothetical protein
MNVLKILTDIMIVIAKGMFHIKNSLWTGRSGDRILGLARFSAPVQTRRGTHPASYTMGTGSFPGVKLPGCGLNHPPSSSVVVKEKVEIYFRCLHVRLGVNFTFTFTMRRKCNKHTVQWPIRLKEETTNGR